MSTKIILSGSLIPASQNDAKSGISPLLAVDRVVLYAFDLAVKCSSSCQTGVALVAEAATVRRRFFFSGRIWYNLPPV